MAYSTEKVEATSHSDVQWNSKGDALDVTIGDTRLSLPRAALERLMGSAATGLNWADLGPSPAALAAQARCLLRDAIGRARGIADPIEFARTVIDLARAVHDFSPAPAATDWGKIEKAMTDGGPLFFDRAADKA